MKRSSHFHLKSPVPSTSKITKKDIPTVNHVLPTEILKKIFELLDFKSLCSARQTCKYWKEIIYGFELLEEASKHIDCIIIARSRDLDTIFEVITGDYGTKCITTYPELIDSTSMVMHNGSILLCRGYSNCLQFCHGLWKGHSTFNEMRVGHAAITTKIATFIFGGAYSQNSFEYLPKNSTTWLMGKTKTPGNGFHNRCAIAVKSEQEIWLIGIESASEGDARRILKFNVNDHTFQILTSKLIMKRYGFRCAIIPNTNKVMITGGMNEKFDHLDSSEILDTEDGSVIMASPMNYPRCNHGMGVITVNGEDRLAVFGGDRNAGAYKLDSVELYNTQTEEWETTNIKLPTRTSDFGFLSLKLKDVISML